MGTEATGTSPKPLLVLASRETAELRDAETAFFSAGYRVVTARTEHEALLKIHSHQADAIVLDGELGGEHYELCRTLRDDDSVSPAAPIVITQTDTATAADRSDAFHAGAWDLHSGPLDLEELLLRLAVYLKAKAEVDRLTLECLVDSGSGLYNSAGFAQRSDELAALTNRQGLPAACAVFRPAADLPTRASGDRLGRAFKHVGRLSDAIGRTTQSEFAVFAPATNAWAAARLVRRMIDNVTHEVGRVTLRAAFSAALPSQKVSPPILLERARHALELTT